MTLPTSVRAAVERVLEEAGAGGRISEVVPVGGGCINNGARLQMSSGDSFFLKWRLPTPGSETVGLFGAESDGLNSLAAGALASPSAPGTPRVWVPAPVAYRDDPNGPSWLLMEYVESSHPSEESASRMGLGLAAIHRSAHAPGRFGWDRDNWIGSLPQANPSSPSWASFWRNARILPQLERAYASGHLLSASIGTEASRSLERLIDLVPAALSDVTRPELLHGDLWSGNAYTGPAGVPVLIDPAVYRGDGEVDLAMTELFGGFSTTFYEAYSEARPISDAYVSHRRDLYQLYYLLVHVNLFGGSYVNSVLRATASVVSALR
jgi:fructosamine-3-kinase